MTTDDRRRSLHDDLLADLQQGPTRPPAPGAAPRPEPPLPFPTPATTPAVELRITPRNWSPAGWTSTGGGFVFSVGPVRLSLGLAER